MSKTKTEMQELELPSGIKMHWRPGKGKDLRKATRVAGPEDPMGMCMAIVSVVATFDGKPMTMEDMDELPLTDIFAAIGAVMGNGNPLSQTLLMN